MTTQIDPGAVGALAEAAKRFAEWATRLDEATLHDISVSGRRAVIVENLHREAARVVHHLDRLVVPVVAPAVPILSAVDLAELIEGSAQDLGASVHAFPARGDNFTVLAGFGVGGGDAA